MSNAFGKIFKISTFGESHGKAIGVIIDGSPAGIKLSLDQVQLQLNRRKPGSNELSSPRKEKDELLCMAGLEGDETIGGPLCFLVLNQDIKKEDYNDLSKLYRPSHADYTYHQKYQRPIPSGSGRASARETIARVIAGSIANQILNQLNVKITVYSYIHSIHQLSLPTNFNPILTSISYDFCPDLNLENSMKELILKTKNEGDSVGGIIQGVILNPPKNLGEPVYDKFEARLAQAMLSIPATKGFEIGSGFLGTTLKGSEHNDVMSNENLFKTNNNGGTQAGITNGDAIHFKVAFKPTSTIFLPQRTLNHEGQEIEFTPKQGRHDPCVVLRARPIVEAMAYITLLDFYFLNLRHTLPRGINEQS